MTKFKIGDTVRVKSIEWYNENKDKYGDIVFSDKSKFCKSMSQFCGRFITINKIETPVLGCTWYSGVGAFCCFSYWMLEDKPVATTASLSPPFNHPSDPSLESQAATSIKANDILETIKAEQFDKIGNTVVASFDWEQYRFDLIKAVLPALVQGDNSAEHCAKRSIEIADEIIKLLKDEKNISDGIQ